MRRAEEAERDREDQGHHRRRPGERRRKWRTSPPLIDRSSHYMALAKSLKLKCTNQS